MESKKELKVTFWYPKKHGNYQHWCKKVQPSMYALVFVSKLVKGKKNGILV